MSTPALIHDHVERSLERLPSQHRGKARIEALVSILARQVQDAEDAAWALLQERLLGRAVGAQLDQWGALLDIPRQGLVDDLYRALLGAWLLILRSEGTPYQVGQIVERLLGGSAVRYVLRAPAGAAWFTYMDAIDQTRAQLVRDYLEHAVPAGVQITSVVQVPAGYFGFADDPNANGWDGVWSEDIYHDTP